MLENYYSLIPAGGLGSRLWPISRAKSPKFLHDLTGSGHSLLTETWNRLVPLAGKERILVVLGRDHCAEVGRQLPDLKEENMVLEPEPRESSAAIGLAVALLNRQNPDLVAGSFAADHFIDPPHLFRQAVLEAVAGARLGYIVTVGIKPRRASTAFGYIHCGQPKGLAQAPQAVSVDKFVEKPSLDVAERYLEAGNFLWNAGMFIFRTDVLLGELAQNQPDVYEPIAEIARYWDSPRQAEVMQKLWPKIPKIAIDYSVAEPAAAKGLMLTIPAHFDWDDIGDFAALARIKAQRDQKLLILGSKSRVIQKDSSGLVINETGRIISVVGVEDIVIIDTPDALLVTTKSATQKVKNVVERLRKKGQTDVL